MEEVAALALALASALVLLPLRPPCLAWWTEVFFGLSSPSSCSSKASGRRSWVPSRILSSAATSTPSVHGLCGAITMAESSAGRSLIFAARRGALGKGVAGIAARSARVVDAVGRTPTAAAAAPLVSPLRLQLPLLSTIMVGLFAAAAVVVMAVS